MANGLLDFLQTPEGQGILSAAFGGLATARRGAPLNSLGRAGMAGLSGYAGAQDRQQMAQNAAVNKELRDMQIAQMRAGMQQQQRDQQIYGQVTSPTEPQIGMNDMGLPVVEQASVQRRFDPAAALRQGMSADAVKRFAEIEAMSNPKSEVYKPGDVVYKNGKPAFTVPMADQSPTSVKEYQFAKDNGYQGSFQDFKKEFVTPTSQYFTPVPTERGYMSFSGRTGEWRPLTGSGGAPVMPAAQSPRVQGEIVTAKETAEAGVKSKETAKSAVNKSDVMLGQIAQAENLLRQNPTGSGVGSVVDAAGRVVGISSPSAQTAAQLKAVSGWLVANVPRMEGPQSNFDVQNYQTMAGMVGNENIPVSERMAALIEVRRLQEKYRQYNQDKVEPGQQKAEMQEMPKASMSNRGRILLDQSTGKRFRSNGMSWEPL